MKNDLKFRPENNAGDNTLALQTMLDGGGRIAILEPGIYDIKDTLVIHGNTELYFAPGVYLRRSEDTSGSFLLMNRGALTREYDENITIRGLRVIANGVEARNNPAICGMTGEVSFFYVRHLRIYDFECLDIPRLSYALHICAFEDIILDGIHAEGRKDGVHLDWGKQFVIRNAAFRTFDDPIALNAHDYAVATPELGWIEDGLIENCYDLADEDTTGYFCRLLAGAWVDWKEGMEIQQSDTVVHNGRIYRAFQKPDGTKYISKTPPTHEAGMQTHEEINWQMLQEKVLYRCGCRNIHFRNIHLQKKRDVAFSIHFDTGVYSRSFYPGAMAPLQENFIFENIVTENEIETLISSTTPIDSIRIFNSTLDTPCVVELDDLREEGLLYPETKILLQGNVLRNSGSFDLVRCKDGRCCALKTDGTLFLHSDVNARLTPGVRVLGSDIPLE